jgi:DNA-binding NarL/FixJ family response regulator
MGKHILSRPAERSSVCVLGKTSLEEYFIPQLINSHSGFCVKYFTLDYKMGLQVVKTIEPDIAFVNYHHGSFRGSRIAQQLHSENGSLRLVGYSDRYHPRQLFRMLDAGALAFLTFDCYADEWNEAIDTVATGRIFYNRYITHDAIDAFKMDRHTGNAWWRTRLTEEMIMYAVYLKRGVKRDDLYKFMNKRNTAEVNNDLTAIYLQLHCNNKEEFINLVQSEEGFE